MRLKGKTAIVTGAGSGIGRAIAILFAKEGAEVVCVSVHKKNCDKTRDDILGEGGKAISIPTDISNRAQVEAMVKETINHFDKIDILVNNAGIINCFCKVGDVTDEQYDAMFNVNVKGQFLTARACLPYLTKKGGAIVCTSSASAMVAQYSTGVYNATKAAVMFLTKNIAMDYAKDGVRANCICPALVDDTVMNKDVFANAVLHPEEWEKTLEKYPMGRIASPEEIARGALFLASDDASFITGTNLVIDGGFTSL